MLGIEYYCYIPQICGRGSYIGTQAGEKMAKKMAQKPTLPQLIIQDANIHQSSLYRYGAQALHRAQKPTQFLHHDGQL